MALAINKIVNRNGKKLFILNLSKDFIQISGEIDQIDDNSSSLYQNSPFVIFFKKVVIICTVLNYPIW